MDELTKQEKLKRFLADRLTNAAVHSYLLDTFTKKSKTEDVHTLAAERIAINLLNDAWRDLQRFAAAKEQPEQTANRAM